MDCGCVPQLGTADHLLHRKVVMETGVVDHIVVVKHMEMYGGERGGEEEEHPATYAMPR